ncbi:hypothetical protein CFC21_050513 [Triticum aestivum]|nr:uncharacterized protein LOC109736118 [Aegilops tauschii subsp. strangulata]XP_044354290.1 uncharacterized protein LOC123075851 [Triticum aestivum]KAF7040619.1 hypothetical protein CFC21_050513 [Triticum aestivum]
MAAPPPEPPILRTHDELLEEIFLLLPTAADLARASLARASFRRLITGHAFLRRYRTLHPPPLIGVLEVDDNAFFPAQPPHPSAAAARTFAGFDFSCSSFLPSTAGRTWSAIDLFDGRVLLDGAPEERTCDFDHLQLLVRELAVCDPVFRRYILLPAVPGDLTALVPEREDLLDLDTFLAPGDDDEDPLSFRVMWLVRCRRNMLLLVFSSVDGQWHALTFDQCRSVPGTFDPYKDGLISRQFVGRRFCWHPPVLNDLLLLDTHSMEFSAVSLQPELLQCQCDDFVVLEAAQGMLGMLLVINDGHNHDGTYRLEYFVLRNNQWRSEKVIPLPAKYDVLLFGVAGGYALIHAHYTPSLQENPVYFSVDIKTLQVDFFGEGSDCSDSGELYAGFPPSLCAPTI